VRGLIIATVLLASVTARAYTQDEVDILRIEDVKGTKNVIIETKVFGCITKFTLPKSEMKKDYVLDSIAEKSVERANNGCR
jgi:hypothetical protein